MFLGCDTFSTQFTWSQGFPLDVPELAFLANVECQGFRHSSHMCHSKESCLCMCVMDSPLTMRFPCVPCACVVFVSVLAMSPPLVLSLASFLIEFSCFILATG